MTTPERRFQPQGDKPKIPSVSLTSRLRSPFKRGMELVDAVFLRVPNSLAFLSIPLNFFV